VLSGRGLVIELNKQLKDSLAGDIFLLCLIMGHASNLGFGLCLLDSVNDFSGSPDELPHPVLSDKSSERSPL
jgi:hypothetical protein